MPRTILHLWSSLTTQRIQQYIGQSICHSSWSSSQTSFQKHSHTPSPNDQHHRKHQSTSNNTYINYVNNAIFIVQHNIRFLQYVKSTFFFSLLLNDFEKISYFSTVILKMQLNILCPFLVRGRLNMQIVTPYSRPPPLRSSISTTFSSNSPCSSSLNVVFNFSTIGVMMFFKKILNNHRTAKRVSTT